MGRIVLATPNWSDNASLGIANSNPAAPASNLQKTQPTDVWASNDLANIQILLDRGQIEPWNLIALLFTNASSKASWRIRCANSAAGLTTAPFYDSSQGFGLALFLDGDDDEVTVASDPAMDLAEFTLECWIRPENLRRQGILIHTGGTVDAVLAMTSAGKIRAWSRPGEIVDIESPNAIPAGEWTHVAMTYDGATVSLFINGVLLNSQPGVASFGDGDALEIGGVDSSRFYGMIDEVRLWDSARNTSQITATMQAQIDPGTAGLVGYWRLNDGSGTTADDATSNALDGVVAGGAYWRYPHLLWGPDDLSREDRPHALLWNPVGVSCSQMLINLHDPTNTAGNLQAGRLYVSNAWQPRYNFKTGSSPFGFSDPSRFVETAEGAEIALKRDVRPRVRFTLFTNSRQELMKGAWEIFRYRGAHKDVLVVIDPDDGVFRHHGIHYGRLAPTIDFVQEEFDLWEVEYELRGLL